MEIETTISKIDITWKEVHAKLLKEYQLLEKKLSYKEDEISKLKSRLETLQLARDIKNNVVSVNETKVVGDIIQHKNESFVRKMFEWLSKPILKI